MPCMLWAQGTMQQLQHMHQVMKGETWASIAAKYGVSEQALQQANRDVKVKKNKPKKGALLVIPDACPTPEPTAEPAPMVQTHYSHLRIGVLLPLEEESERGAKMVEFYQGLLMAADSIRHTGVDITIHAIHSGSTKASMQHLLSNNKSLQRAHVIFGPVDGAQVDVLNQFCMQHNIHLVMPFSRTQGETNQPLAYIATAPANVSASNAASLATKTMGKNVNYVILNTNESDTRGSLFTGKLKEALAEQGTQTRMLNIEGDDFAYESAFNQTMVNCIVPDNVGIKSLNILCARLKSFTEAHPQYAIRLLGYPEWVTYTSTLLNSFYRFDTYAYCTYYNHPLSASTQSFGSAFASNFGHPMIPSFPCFAMMGFDMGLYFMSGLATLGETFDSRQDELVRNPIQHPFLFRQDTEGGERMNHFVQMVHYSPDQKITLVQ